MRGFGSCEGGDEGILVHVRGVMRGFGSCEGVMRGFGVFM